MESEKSSKSILHVLKNATAEFFEEGAFFHGAALAYYTLFALIPLLYLTLISFGKIFGEDMCINAVTEIFQKNIGIEDISVFTAYLKNLNNQSKSFSLNLVMIIALLYSCSAFMVSLKYSINDFFNIQKRKREKLNVLMDILKFRFLSLAYLAVFALLILLSYFIQIFAFSVLENWLSSSFGNVSVGVILFHHLFSILLNLLIIAFIFKFVHDGMVRWSLAFKGALLTSLLLFMSQVIIKYYLQHYFFLGKGDVVGSMFVLMAWVFYSAQVIFFGAKFTYVYGKAHHEVPQ
ncbi:MAG: YihY/virulence factor BrkB family protein [Cryomorphaceae bacterium]|nr:YihY/virulence factor BrkB family protein [Cryomorphaceae bacterium]